MSVFSSFLKGLINGMVAPAITFIPQKTRIRPDHRIYKSVYRSHEEDIKNLLRDSEKIFGKKSAN